MFTNLGVPWVGDVMNAIVLTAALSSCNSGLYSTGRVLRSLADRKEAPAFAGKMSRNHVPYGGVLFTSVVYVARRGAELLRADGGVRHRDGDLVARRGDDVGDWCF